MSEIPANTEGVDPATDPDVAPVSGPRALMYAVYAAMMADMGCLIGAVAFFVLIIASAIFAAELTPCTSAGGIPCAH